MMEFSQKEFKRPIISPQAAEKIASAKQKYHDFVNSPEYKKHDEIVAKLLDLDYDDFDIAYKKAGGPEMDEKINKLAENVRQAKEYADGTSKGNMLGGESLPVALHEIQHAVQGYEGFSRGGNPKHFYQNILKERQYLEGQLQGINSELRQAVGTPRYNELLNTRQDIVDKLNSKGFNDAATMAMEADRKYRNLAGEAEARQTANRQALTMSERLSQYPYAPETFFNQTGVKLEDLTFQ